MFERWRTPQGPGTHYLMDGGILDVPHADTDAFFVEYLAALRTKHKVYVVEQKTPVFKFFVDLDWRDDTPLSDERLAEIVQVMSSVVPGRVCIARAQPRPEDGRIKSGVHIHWPDTKVRRAEALAFRTRMLLELGDDPEWNTRIDSSVYGGSGLRMIGSHKIPVGDPYVPVTPGQITIETLREYSIRTQDDDESLAQVVEVTNYAPLEKYIQKYIPGQERTRIKRVIRRSPRILWIQTDSQYCAHICKEHKSNHVWFYVFEDTISQRCHDEDTCKGYVGREYILSPSIVDELTSNVTVDRSTCVSICDLVPAHWFPENTGTQVRTSASPVLGTGSERVGTVQRKSSSLRGRRGRGGRRASTQSRN